MMKLTKEERELLAKKLSEPEEGKIAVRHYDGSVFYKDLEQAILEGRIRKELAITDRILTCHRDLGEVEFDVIGHDAEETVDKRFHHNITLQMHTKIIAMAFNSEDSGKKYNAWANSDIRRYLNSQDFIEGFNRRFRNLITPVYKKSNEFYTTVDNFFLLSWDEMRGNSTYKGYSEARYSWARKRDGEDVELYWTRTEHKSPAQNNRVWTINDQGTGVAEEAQEIHFIRPACTIGF